jgi:tetratricopeptide (TPR) repeat protein
MLAASWYSEDIAVGADLHRLALELFQKGYQLQMQGELERAADLYRRSIATCPTAEAHTFLGWTYHFQGRNEAAIEECRKAIEADPSLGNPYNDIGAYLIELKRGEEAIPWLEQATRAERYTSYHLPWFHLGTVYQSLEWYRKAIECFENALDIEPEYRPASEALDKVRRLIH